MFIEGKINPYWDINYFKKLKCSTKIHFSLIGHTNENYFSIFFVYFGSA